jgi:hypothetical protein
LVKSGDVRLRASPDFFALRIFASQQNLFQMTLSIWYSLYFYPDLSTIFFYENTSFIHVSFCGFDFAGFSGIFAATGQQTKNWSCFEWGWSQRICPHWGAQGFG